MKAQGEFLEKGQSGFAAEGNAETGEGNYGLSASAGYSIGGIFDLGISCSKVFLNEKDWGPSAETRGWGPSITCHLIKHSDMVPYSLGVYATYYKQYLRGSTGIAWNSAESRTTLLGVHGLYRVPMRSGTSVIPGGGVAYAMGTVKYMQWPGITKAIEHDTYVELSFTVLCSLPLGERHHLVFGPYVSAAGSLFAGGFNLEIVLGGSLPAASDKIHYKAGGKMDAEQ